MKGVLIAGIWYANLLEMEYLESIQENSGSKLVIEQL